MSKRINIATFHAQRVHATFKQVDANNNNYSRDAMLHVAIIVMSSIAPLLIKEMQSKKIK